MSSSSIPERLASQYTDLAFMKEKMATMKQNQQMRGLENYTKRMTERATTHNTWRQMKGFQLAMHEIKHPGNRAFVIGLGIMTTLWISAYRSGLASEDAKKSSDYWQRFHAKNGSAADHHPHH